MAKVTFGRVMAASAALQTVIYLTHNSYFDDVELNNELQTLQDFFGDLIQGIKMEKAAHE